MRPLARLALIGAALAAALASGSASARSVPREIDTLDFVGPRNDGRRFPNYARVALGVEHRFKILGLQPWIGVRADNAFKAFLPIDVQPNIGSPHFGTFYNSEFRQMRLQVRFER